jgi:lipoprotein-anchoring transpeptidase ErfK/SrfK
MLALARARLPRLLLASSLSFGPLGMGLAVAAGTATPPAQPPPAPPARLAAPAEPRPLSDPPTRDRSYHLETFRGGAQAVARRFGPELVPILEKLNRADAAHLGRLGVLAVPDEPIADELLVSPLPLAWGWAANLRKAIVVDQPSQVFGAYECGRLVRWGPVSSGRQKRPTPAGLFHLNWRSPGRASTENPDWYMTWYFNFDSPRGLALHQLELPGRPASHACVRLLERDARWIYGWGEGWTRDPERRRVIAPGTPVLVLDSYGFGAPPPWRSLAWLAHGVDLPEDMPAPAGD